MSKTELEEFLLQTSKSELMILLQEASSAKLHELEDAICLILNKLK